MSDPKPLEYELEDHDAKPPETEAEALARLHREDEERARQLGLVKEKGAPAGKRWQDGIGGNRASGTAMRLMEQEARLAERQRQARAATMKTVVVSAVLLVGLVVGGALAADYTGLVRLGIVGGTRPDGAASAQLPGQAQPIAAERQAAAIAAPVAAQPEPRSRIQVLAVAGDAEPLPNPPSEAPPGPTVRGPAAEVAKPVDSDSAKRAQKRIDGAQRGVDSVNSDLAEKRGHIEANLKALYGIVPAPRDVVPERTQWRAPCAMIALESAQSAVMQRATPETTLALNNAQAEVNNLHAYLKHNRGVEKDIISRLKAATRRLDEAKAELAAAK